MILVGEGLPVAANAKHTHSDGGQIRQPPEPKPYVAPPPKTAREIQRETLGAGLAMCRRHLARARDELAKAEGSIERGDAVQVYQAIFAGVRNGDDASLNHLHASDVNLSYWRRLTNALAKVEVRIVAELAALSEAKP